MKFNQMPDYFRKHFPDASDNNEVRRSDICIFAEKAKVNVEMDKKPYMDLSADMETMLSDVMLGDSISVMESKLKDMKARAKAIYPAKKAPAKEGGK